ncbi:hypothetical protein KIL84_001074 [Mauremys mutica]|uniref:Uncharacterized protein n=1 Tax=Mauremys mutica TaxID=74926 RepID=A0A9D3WXV0_9SAUR|nr:hypothetical protein KIL84_001074 [Mauremys mutica]
MTPSRAGLEPGPNPAASSPWEKLERCVDGHQLPPALPPILSSHHCPTLILPLHPWPDQPPRFLAILLPSGHRNLMEELAPAPGTLRSIPLPMPPAGLAAPGPPRLSAWLWTES